MARINVGFQKPNKEPEVMTCDGFMLACVTRGEGGKLSVLPVVQNLTYDEIARALVATNVAVWREHVGIE